MRKKILPSTHIIIILSIIIYYWVSIKTGSMMEKILIASFILGIIFPYFLKKNQKKNKDIIFNYEKMRKVSIIFLLIGLISHIIFYLPNMKSLVDYGSGYTLSRGKGYLTVFFDFYILGLLFFMQVASIRKKTKDKILILFFITIYVFFYFFILMKRRQVILVLLGLITIYFGEKLYRRKFLVYVSTIFGYLTFSVLGKARGAFDMNGIKGAIIYIYENFSLEWISFSNFEGKYMSMILGDVIEYVEYFNLDPSVILGVINIFIPRSLFGYKYLAFPEWYTFNFHPNLYSIGTGYAGSIIGELYLIGHVPLVIIGGVCVGLVCKKIDKLFEREYLVLYSIGIYMMFLLPRLDLASIVIMTTFLIIPSIVTYIISIKHGGKYEQ